MTIELYQLMLIFYVAVRARSFLRHAVDKHYVNTTISVVSSYDGIKLLKPAILFPPFPFWNWLVIYLMEKLTLSY